MSNPVRILTVARKGGIIALVSALVVSMSVAFEVEAAEAGSWVVELADGAVTVDGQAADAPEARVGPGAVIETGADGNVVLTRPGDSITVFPNSKMSVSSNDSGAEPGILQMFGKLLFRMESRESRDFEITTPYLAAAIKGTTFTVEVDKDDAVVEVEEGSVLVTANRSGQSAIVGAGERAGVSGDDSDSVKITAVQDNKGKKEKKESETVTKTETEAEASTKSESESESESGGGNQSRKKDSPSDSDSGGGNDPGNKQRKK